MIFLSLTLAVLSAAPPATAPKKDSAKREVPKKDDGDAAGKAKEAFQWAQRLYKQARYTEAIAKFEEAYAMRPHPVIYFNIGKCYEQLGETAKALRAYRDYLRMAPDANDQETVTDAIANLERRLKERGLQQVLVYADPPSARIEVDGKELGTSPASVELVAGNHKLSVKAEGFAPSERAFVVTSGRSTEMTITLRPAKDALSGLSPPPPPPLDVPKKEDPRHAASLTPKDNGGPTAVVQSGTPGSKGRTFTWVAAGVAVVGAGVGVGLGISAQGSANALTQASQPHTQAEAQALYNQAQGNALAANISYGVAAAAAVTAVVLFFVEGR